MEPPITPVSSKNPFSNKRLRIALIAVLGVIVVVVGGIVAFTIANRDPERVIIGKNIYYHQPEDEAYVEDEEAKVSYVNDEFLVYATPNATQDQLVNALGGNAKLVGKSQASNSYQFKLTEPLAYTDLVALTERIKELAFVHDARPITKQVSTSLPLSVIEPVSNAKDKNAKTWGLDAIQAKEAWKELGEEDPGSGVAVGIIDTQFYGDHEDLQGAWKEVQQPLADGFSGWYNCPEYFNSADWKQDPTYDSTVYANDSRASQGTQVAGIIAGRNNDEGSTGVAYGATLYGWQDGFSIANRSADGSVKTSSEKDLAHTLEWLVGECGCKVINFSGGYGNSGKDTKEARAAYAQRIASTLHSLLTNGHEFVVVVSAGNDPKAAAATTSVFSSITDGLVKNRIIVVGSASMTAKGEYVVSECSSGGDRVDVLAPGGSIWNASYAVSGTTHDVESSYEFTSGTAMAAPMVSGVAALAFQANPDLAGWQVKDLICNSNKDAKTYAGTSGNSTPAKRIVNAKSVVDGAKKAEGKGNLITNQETAIGFVKLWYEDFQTEDCYNAEATYSACTDGSDSYPQRLIPMLENNSDAKTSFEGDLAYPKSGFTCVLGYPGAKYIKTENGHDVFEITVKYGATEHETINTEGRKKLLQNPKEAVWEVGVNTETGKVDHIANKSGYE